MVTKKYSSKIHLVNLLRIRRRVYSINRVSVLRIQLCVKLSYLSSPNQDVCVCGCDQEVVERFHRNKSKWPSEDVAERVFLFTHNRIDITYHLEDDRFIPSKRSFIKPKALGEKRVEPFRPDMVSSFQVHRQYLKKTFRFLAASAITQIIRTVMSVFRWIHLRSPWTP